MIRFILGFVIGTYTGTTYDVKPVMNTLIELIKKNFPKKD
jgi:hypothetical protein